MDASSLVELYFRTTLELRDDSGQLYRITPVEPGQTGSAVEAFLEPFSDAFILTAENPESSGTFSVAENEAATAELRAILSDSPVVFRQCPGYAFDSDHVEPGFAVLARQSQRDELLEFTLSLARRFRQNAIFQLNSHGLAIVGALRDDLTGVRPVVIERT